MRQNYFTAHRSEYECSIPSVRRESSVETNPDNPPCPPVACKSQTVWMFRSLMQVLTAEGLRQQASGGTIRLGCHEFCLQKSSLLLGKGGFSWGEDTSAIVMNLGAKLETLHCCLPWRLLTA